MWLVEGEEKREDKNGSMIEKEEKKIEKEEKKKYD